MDRWKTINYMEFNNNHKEDDLVEHLLVSQHLLN